MTETTQLLDPNIDNAGTIYAEDVKPGEIRLLRIHAASNHESDQLVDITISTFSIGDAPAYTARSCTWGSERPLSTVNVNGSKLMVRGNLHDFLSVAKHDPDMTRDSDWFWIDQITINQFNIFERNDQVMHMAEIYKNSPLVR